MTNLFKRRWLQAAALTAVSAAVLVGCGKKKKPNPLRRLPLQPRPSL